MLKMAASKYEVLIKVAELGSLTKAAEALGYSQSNISHVISALEEEFGFPLFLRGRSGARMSSSAARTGTAMPSSAGANSPVPTPWTTPPGPSSPRTAP